MNTLKSACAILLIFAACTIFVSCQSEPKAPAPPPIERAKDVNGKEYTSRYICPMRCVGSGTEVKGQICPACEMKLRENRNHPHYGHNH